MQQLYLGVDIGGTFTKYGFITTEGKVLAHHKIKTDCKIDFQKYAENLFQDVQKNFSKFSDDYFMCALGVGAPNGNGQNGFIENPPNLAWGEVDLRAIFTDVFGLKVVVENDANIAAMAEKKFGGAQHLENFIVLTLGTGLGVGTYINGELFLGSHGVGSEAGHMTIIPKGRLCGCGSHGHLEAYASCTGMAQTVNEALNDSLSFREISHRFQNSDSEVKNALGECAMHLALGLASMNALLAPQSFILCGGGSSLGDDFVTMIESYYQKFVYDPFRNFSKIELSKISNEYGAILGAAALVMEK